LIKTSLKRTPLWIPSPERARQANLARFSDFVARRHGLSFGSYQDLHKWSVERIGDFWSAMWDFTGIVYSSRFDKVVDNIAKFPGAEWFLGARLNFAENLLRHRNGNIAIVSRPEGHSRSQLTYAELYSKVNQLAHGLLDRGVRQGDRVAGYLSNIPETTIAMLAATSIGAVWACCGAELGPQAVLDRLGQIRPKILFSVDGYVYKGKKFDISHNVKSVVDGIPSIEKVVSIHHLDTDSTTRVVPRSVAFDDFSSSKPAGRIPFEQLPANHPVYIMFTSGTTGKPKCMVQGAAGVLVNQLKETMLHADVKNSDRITYITSPSWMMWNWLMSCLASGSTIDLFDGNPLHPDWGTMWRLVEEEKLTVLGCSASYLTHLRSIGARPGKDFDLSSLREISQTGSPLSSEGFEWVYREVKPDLHLNSISGGTDINGCFAGGVPTLPVYAGELQGPGLGMKINVYEENGQAVVDKLGELVCEAPAPPMPLYFWNDPSGEKYREAYFEYFRSKGKNVWRHGDFVMCRSDTGGYTFYGRSDAVIKASGVRVGTSEIYNIVEKIPEVEDSLAVGQNWAEDQRVILFVKLAPNCRLTSELKDKIKMAIREEASPRHVPALIIEAPDIPYTLNMKKVEVAVANIVNNRPVANRDSLANPESLDFYTKILPQLQAK
jgi:acetoacetyl-CoA synthetase